MASVCVSSSVYMSACLPVCVRVSLCTCCKNSRRNAKTRQQHVRVLVLVVVLVAVAVAVHTIDIY